MEDTFIDQIGRVEKYQAAQGQILRYFWDKQVMGASRANFTHGLPLRPGVLAQFSDSNNRLR